jgi:hypothetical protein
LTRADAGLRSMETPEAGEGARQTRQAAPEMERDESGRSE